MTFFTRRRALWLVINLAAAVLLPLAFGWWLDRQVRSSESPLPGGFNPETLILVFTVSWAGFLLLLNVTMALFLWLRRH